MWLDPEFHPRDDVARGDHVLYVGPLGRDDGVLELLNVAAHSRERWPLQLVGAGPLERRLRRRAERLRISDRMSVAPPIANRDELARAYASAAVVVVPGPDALAVVALEAAACGTHVVCCETSLSARLLGPLADTFPPGSTAGLAAAIFRARLGDDDHARAWRLAERRSVLPIGP